MFARQCSMPGRLATPICVVLAAALCGCPTAATGPAGTAGTAATSASTAAPLTTANLTPVEIFTRLAQAYAKAEQYHDQGELRIRFVRDGREEGTAAKAALTFARPNRFRLEYNGVDMASDGRELVARIVPLPDQLLVRPAPAELSAAVLEVDPLLAQFVGGPDSIARQMLELFLPGAEQAMAERAQGAKLLPAGAVEGRTCYRVALSAGGVAVVYCIDAESFILRRLELPTEEWRAQNDPRGEIQSLSISLDFVAASTTTALPEQAFQIERPQGVYVVKRFLDRLRPAPPSPLLGTKVPVAKLRLADGRVIETSAFADKITVIEFWATWCGWCMQTLPRVEAVRKQYASQTAVEFWAVSLDAESVSDADVAKSYAQAQANLTLARDFEGTLMKAFSADQLPMLAVIDGDGVIQMIELGANELVEAQLPGKLDALRAGKSLFEDSKRQYAVELDQYQQALVAAGVEDAVAPAAAPSDIAPATKSDPEKLVLEPAWTVPAVRLPGNVLPILEKGDAKQLIVVDGFRSVAELALDGTLKAAHDLKLPETTVFTLVRSALSPSGQRMYAITAPGQTQAFVYDANWKRLLAYPPQPAETLTSVELGPLGPAGEPRMLVSFYGGSGIHAVTPTGELAWSYRKHEDVLDIEFGGLSPNAPLSVFFTSGRGSLGVLDQAGRAVEEWFVGRSASLPLGRLLLQVCARDLDGDGQDELCGLAKTETQENVAVGIGPDGRELWSYPLPKGDYLEPIEPIVTGRLPGMQNAVWLLAGTDGSIHLVNIDGEPLDHFQYGRTLTGLALVKHGEQHLLCIASHRDHQEYSLAAYEVTFKAGIMPPVAKPIATATRTDEAARPVAPRLTSPTERAPSLVPPAKRDAAPAGSGAAATSPVRSVPSTGEAPQLAPPAPAVPATPVGSGPSLGGSDGPSIGPSITPQAIPASPPKPTSSPQPAVEPKPASDPKPAVAPKPTPANEGPSLGPQLEP